MDIGFIHNQNAVEAPVNSLDFIERKRIPGGVVGGANPHCLGVGVGGRNQSLDVETEVVGERHSAIFHIIDVGTHLIHPVTRVDSHHIIHSRHAEHAIHQVDTFVATHTEEYLLGLHPFDVGKFLFHCNLQRVGVSVVGRVVWRLVGIEQNSRFPFELVSCTTVGLQIEYVFSHQIFDFHIRYSLMWLRRHVTACLWAMRSSFSAIISIVPPSACKPSFERRWKVILRI